MPLSSFIEKSAGPDHPLHAARAQPRLGGVEQRLQHLLVVLELEEAEPAPVLLLVVVEGVVDLGGDPSHDAPVASGEEVLGLAVAEERVHAPVQEQPALELRRGHPQRVVSMQPEGQVDERFQVSACPDDRACSLDRSLSQHPTCSTSHQTSSPRSAATSASEVLAAAREADVLPYFHVLTSAGDAGRRDGGRPADHARLQQLPRADRRRARDAGRRGRAAPLRHRPDRLAPAQRHDPAAPGARARDRRVDGHRGRARVHDRPPGQPRRRSARSCSARATR